MCGLWARVRLATQVGAVLAGSVPDGAVFLGDGAERHRETIEAAGHAVLAAPAGEPTPDALVRFLGLISPAEPVAVVERWEPSYLKGSSAVRP